MGRNETRLSPDYSRMVTAGISSNQIHESQKRALIRYSALSNVTWLRGGPNVGFCLEDLPPRASEECPAAALCTGRKGRKTRIRHDRRRYKRRNPNEIMFGRLEDWRRVTTRYNRCSKVFLSVIALAAPSSFGTENQCVWSLSQDPPDDLWLGGPNGGGGSRDRNRTSRSGQTGGMLGFEIAHC